MGLHVITGPATAGKSGLLHTAIERASHVGPSVLALPATPDVHRAANEFARKRILGIQITQLDSWIETLWQLHGDGRRLVRAPLRDVLLGRAVACATPRRLGDVADAAGFRDLLSEIVVRAPRSRPASVGGIVGEIALMCDRYWRELEISGYIEHAEAARLLGASPPDGIAAVGVNRFTDLSASQESFLVGLSASTDVHISLTWQEGLPSTEALDPLMERLLGAASTHTVVEEGEWTEPSLEALARGLYQGCRLEEPVSSLELIEASGTDAECAGVARRVRGLIDGGASPHDIAVVARDLRSRAPALSAAFRAMGVEADFDMALPFGATGLGRALLGLIGAIAEPRGDRETLLAFVLSPYSGIDPEQASDADRAWRRSRLHGPALLRAACELPEMATIVSLIRNDMVVRGPAPWAKRWHRVGSLLLANASRRRGLAGIEGRLDAAAHRTLTLAIDELAMAGEGLDPGGVLRALSRTTVSTGSTDDRSVQVTEAHRVRGRRFDTVVAMGLTAHEFSSEKSASLAAVLLRGLGEPARPDERLSERMLFYTIVTRARRRLILSRQASDERGEAVRPSAFWDEVIECVGGCGSEIAGAVPVLRLSSNDLARTAPVFTPGRIRDRAMCTSPQSKPSRRGLTDNRALAADLVDHEFSASEIEKYLSCPYRWFVERALRPQELDRTIDARERGTYAHGLLKAFYEAWGAQQGGRVTPETLDDALQIFSSTEEVYRAASRLRPTGAAEQVAVSKATRWARSIVVDDASFLCGFEPAGHEVGFGSASGVPFVFGGVKMRGRIDRVECGPPGVVAIDYKSASAVSGVSSFETYGLLQPTVYAAAAAQIFDRPALGGVYRSLRSLSVRGFWRDGALDPADRGSSKDALDDEAFRAEFDRAAHAVTQAVDGMMSGRIAPEPAKPSTCTHCLLGGICGVV